MTKTERNVTIIVALIGMVSGLAGAYISWGSAKFKQPLDKRLSIASSFKGQIESAEKRKDAIEIKRLRAEYEKFEESYRKDQYQLSQINSFVNLPPSEIPKENRLSIMSWLNEMENNPNHASVFSVTDIGNARFIVGDYEKAASVYSSIIEKHPNNAYGLMSQARAYRYLSINATDKNKALAYNTKAVVSAQAALEAGGLANANLPSAILTDPELSSLIEEVKKITNKSTETQ